MMPWPSMAASQRMQIAGLFSAAAPATLELAVSSACI